MIRNSELKHITLFCLIASAAFSAVGFCLFGSAGWLVLLSCSVFSAFILYNIKVKASLHCKAVGSVLRNNARRDRT